MSADSELQEIEAAGVKFRESRHGVTVDDLERMMLSASPASSKEDEPPPLPTPEELRERARLQEIEAEVRAKKLEARRARDREIRAERWRTGEVVAQEWRQASIDKLPSQVADSITKWLTMPEGERWSLVLFGATGVGKTYTMYAALRELYIERFDFEVVEVATLMDSLRPSDNSARVFERMKRVEVLALDDLGAEASTAWTTERLDMIINERWQNRRPLIVTTNIAPVDLADTLGERTKSRLLGNSVLIKVAGVDRRINRG